MTLAERLERAHRDPAWFARFFPYGCAVTGLAVVSVVSLRDAFAWAFLGVGLATVAVSLRDLGRKTRLGSRQLARTLDGLEAAGRIHLRVTLKSEARPWPQWAYQAADPPARPRLRRTVRREHRILGTLARHPGSVYGLDLAKSTGIAPGPLWRHLNALIDRGLVRTWRVEPVGDGPDAPRRRYYALTVADTGGGADS